MAEVDELREAVEREYPRYDERTGDWDDILRRAATPPPRRSSWLVRGVVVAGAAAAAVVLLLIAPWRTESSILDRALAAIGDGPVLHAVLRDDALPAGTLVDLRTGERKRISGTREVWYDTDRGLIREVSRFGGAVEHDEVYTTGVITQRRTTIPIGIGTTDIAQLSRDYREALKAGKARVSGRDEVEGIPVYWITLPQPAVSVSGPGAPERVEQVAVSRETYEPVRIRTMQVGGVCKRPCVTTDLRVLRFETKGAGAADVIRSKGRRLAAGLVTVRGPDKIPLGRAAEVLGRTPVWLGRKHAGLPLARTSSHFLQLGSAREPSSVDLLYGKATDDPGPFISITETADREFAARIRDYGSSLKPGSRMGYVPPEGSVLITRSRSGLSGFLVRDGVYVRMGVSGEKLLLDAARALRPLSAGSGAGG